MTFCHLESKSAGTLSCNPAQRSTGSPVTQIVVSDFAHVNVYDPESVCVFVSVCVFLASDSSETVEVIIINLGTVTASDMRMQNL